MSLVSTIIEGDCREVLKGIEPESVQTCITSPPYFGLRDYGHGDQIGLEETPEKFVDSMVQVFREVKRVLRDDGTLWLNLGDSYNGSGGAGGDYNKGGLKEGQPKYNGRNITTLKPKDLIGIPWKVAFALQSDGWYLRQDIIWHKPNPMPESVTDRCTKSHEYIFLLSKNKNYYYDNDSIREPHTWEEKKPRPSGMARNASKYREKVKYGGGGSGLLGHKGSYKADGSPLNHPLGKNKRSVWTVTTKPFKEAHFATFPEKLIEPCILAGSKNGDTVLDPFSGAGTTGLVAVENNRNYLGIELNPEYKKIADRRILSAQPYLTL